MQVGWLAAGLQGTWFSQHAQRLTPVDVALGHVLCTECIQGPMGKLLRSYGLLCCSNCIDRLTLS